MARGKRRTSRNIPPVEELRGDVDLELGFKLANSRDDFRLREISSGTGLSLTTVHNISRNRGDPTLSTILLMCEWWQIRASEFFRLCELRKTEREAAAANATKDNADTAADVNDKNEDSNDRKVGK